MTTDASARRPACRAVDWKIAVNQCQSEDQPATGDVSFPGALVYET